MRQLIVMIATALAISSCSFFTPPNMVSAKTDLTKQKHHGLLLMSGYGQFSVKQPNVLRLLYVIEPISKIGELEKVEKLYTMHHVGGRGMMMGNYRSEPLYSGTPMILHLPEGKYRIKEFFLQWQISTSSGQYTTIYPYKIQKDLNVPFTIKKGKTTYLGRVEFAYDPPTGQMTITQKNTKKKDLKDFLAQDVKLHSTVKKVLKRVSVHPSISRNRSKTLSKFNVTWTTEDD